MIRRWRKRVLVIFATVSAVFVLPVILLAIDGWFYVMIGRPVLAPLTADRALVALKLALIAVLFYKLCPKGDR